MNAVSTPWGIADEVEHLGEGIVRYGTPSHGGVYVSDEWLSRAPRIFRLMDKKQGKPEANWFEEDIDMLVPLYLFNTQLYEPKQFNDETMDRFKRLIRQWHPDVYEELTGEEVSPWESVPRQSAILDILKQTPRIWCGVSAIREDDNEHVKVTMVSLDERKTISVPRAIYKQRSRMPMESFVLIEEEIDYYEKQAAQSDATSETPQQELARLTDEHRQTRGALTQRYDLEMGVLGHSEVQRKLAEDPENAAREGRMVELEESLGVRRRVRASSGAPFKGAKAAKASKAYREAAGHRDENGRPQFSVEVVADGDGYAVSIQDTDAWRAALAEGRGEATPDAEAPSAENALPNNISLVVRETLNEYGTFWSANEESVRHQMYTDHPSERDIASLPDSDHNTMILPFPPPEKVRSIFTSKMFWNIQQDAKKSLEQEHEEREEVESERQARFDEDNAVIAAREPAEPLDDPDLPSLD